MIENYRGAKAKKYEEARRQNPKWHFEDETLRSSLQECKEELDSVIDAPVGTGRFLEKYLELGKRVQVTGIDYSGDMLKMAAAREGTAGVKFLRHDVINKPIPVAADFIVCYRFLNLVAFQKARQAMSNLFASSIKYVMFSIRTVADNYNGETYIEDKIYLHKLTDIHKVISDNGFKTVKDYKYNDERPGQYAVFLCRRVNASAPAISTHLLEGGLARSIRRFLPPWRTALE